MKCLNKYFLNKLEILVKIIYSWDDKQCKYFSQWVDNFDESKFESKDFRHVINSAVGHKGVADFFGPCLIPSEWWDGISIEKQSKIRKRIERCISKLTDRDPYMNVSTNSIDEIKKEFGDLICDIFGKSLECGSKELLEEIMGNPNGKRNGEQKRC